MFGVIYYSCVKLCFIWVRIIGRPWYRKPRFFRGYHTCQRIDGNLLVTVQREEGGCRVILLGQVFGQFAGEENPIGLVFTGNPVQDVFKCKKQVFDQQFSEKLVSADFGKQLLHILIDKAVMRQRAAASLLGA